MALETITNKSLGWRWIAVASLFVLGLGSFAAGVTLSERPFTESDGLAVQIYYILGLFVVGGLDLGVCVCVCVCASVSVGAGAGAGAGVVRRMVVSVRR